MESLAKIYTELRLESRKVIIVMHQKPDADAMGSSLALMHYLKGFGHQVTVISPTNWANYLAWMPGIREVLDYEAQTDVCDTLLEAAAWLFCLDFNTLSRTKRMAAKIAEAQGTRILIDHHQEPQLSAFDFGVSESSKSSTAEMVYDFISESGGEAFITADISTCLYAGLVSDTGSFRFPATSASVHRMVATLMEHGLSHAEVHDKLFDNFLENRLRFIGHALLYRMEVIYDLNTVLLSIPSADLQKFDIGTGDTEGLVNFPFSIKGIKMVAIVIDRDDERKWSFRSKGAVDVNQFARQFFGGGGHKNAAGGYSHESLSKTVQFFHKALESLRDQLAEY